MILNINLRNFEKFLLIFSLSCFIYGWSIKYEFFQLRLLVFLPIFFIVINTIKSKKYNFLIFPIIFFLFLLIHFFLVSYFKGNLNFNILLYILAASLIAVIISYYYLEIVNNLHLIVKYFLILIIPVMIVNIYQAYNYASIDGSLFLRQLYFNCDNSVINFGKFFFKENSHFSLIAVPVLISFIFIEKKLINKFFIILFSVFIIINLIFFSTTLIVSIIFCSFIYFIYFGIIAFKELKKINIDEKSSIKFSNKYGFIKLYFNKIKKLILIFLIPLFLLYQPTCEKKFMETVYLITKVENDVIMENYESMPRYKETGYEVNSSSSTYYYTLLVTLETFKKYPFGVGFNDYYFGYLYSKPLLDWFVNKESPIMVHDYAENVNQRDGYNNFAKLVVEFGIFNLIFIPIYLKFIFTNKINLFNKLFISSLILTQLLKGVGYFNGGFILGILFMLITVYLDKKKLNV